MTSIQYLNFETKICAALVIVNEPDIERVRLYDDFHELKEFSFVNNVDVAGKSLRFNEEILMQRWFSFNRKES